MILMGKYLTGFDYERFSDMRDVYDNYRMISTQLVYVPYINKDYGDAYLTSSSCSM